VESSTIYAVKSVVETVASHKCSTMRNVGCVVIDNCSVMPIEPPVAPSPSKAGEETQAESLAEANSQTSDIETRIRRPAGPNREWCAIDKPRIVLWDVDNIRIYRFDHDSLPLCCYAIGPERIASLYLDPGISLILRKGSGVIVIGCDV
jgi:hypothetical protein